MPMDATPGWTDMRIADVLRKWEQTPELKPVDMTPAEDKGVLALRQKVLGLQGRDEVPSDWRGHLYHATTLLRYLRSYVPAKDLEKGKDFEKHISKAAARVVDVHSWMEHAATAMLPWLEEVVPPEVRALYDEHFPFTWAGRDKRGIPVLYGWAGLDSRGLVRETGLETFLAYDDKMAFFWEDQVFGAAAQAGQGHSNAVFVFDLAGFEWSRCIPRDGRLNTRD